MGRRAFFAKVDVTKSADIEPFVENVISRLGKIDIGTRGQSLETVSDEEWHEFMDGIMNSMFYMAKPVARHMIARDEGGVIVNVTSINAFIISNIAPRYNVPSSYMTSSIVALDGGATGHGEGAYEARRYARADPVDRSDEHRDASRRSCCGILVERRASEDHPMEISYGRHKTSPVLGLIL